MTAVSGVSPEIHLANIVVAKEVTNCIHFRNAAEFMATGDDVSEGGTHGNVLY